MNYLLLLSIVLSLNLSQAQDPYFGDKCIGKWQGMMYMYNQGHLKDSVLVNLQVEKLTATSWTWKTEYLSPTLPMVKAYTLRLVDEKQNKYMTDEGDGIELVDYLFGNKLYNIFETGAYLLTSSYELVGENLIFEVTSGRKEPESHPEVSSYSVDNLQRVVFKKVK